MDDLLGGSPAPRNHDGAQNKTALFDDANGAIMAGVAGAESVDGASASLKSIMRQNSAELATLTSKVLG